MTGGKRGRIDPTGEERATFLARLEYGVTPLDDGRTNATYRETPETLHADRLRRFRQALAEGRVHVAPTVDPELTRTMAYLSPDVDWTTTPTGETP